MIRINLHLKRPAVAMIELVFAIVIMGITLMSAPMLLNMSINSSNTAMQQESIAAASSQISLILTYPWDEGNTADTTGYDILSTDGDAELNSTSRWIYKRVYNDINHTQVPSTSATFGNNIDAGDVSDDDIDDFSGMTTHVTLYQNETSSLASNEGEYLKGNLFDMNTNVTYVDDATPDYSAGNIVFNNPNNIVVGTSNIKRITVTLTDTTAISEHNQSVSLYAFACNIGDGTPSIVRVGAAR